jgi:hypothetical protein
MGFMTKAEKPGQLPAKFKKKFSSAAALMEARFGGNTESYVELPQLSIRGGKFRIRENGEETVIKNGKRAATELNVVIIDGRPNESHQFYDKEYDEGGDNEAPVCVSTDGKFPDASSTKPQASACALCPKHKFGSRGKGRACSVYRRVILFVIGPDGEPVMKEDLPLALYMDLPVMSLVATERKHGAPGFYAYVKQLASIGAPLEYVVTELSFNPEATHPQLTFEMVGALEDEGIAAVDELKETEDVLDAVDVDVEKADGAAAHSLEDEEEEEAPAPRQTRAKAQPKKAAPPPEVEDDADEDEDIDEDSDDDLAEAAASEIDAELEGLDFDD